MFQKGNYAPGTDNPWIRELNNAPFNKEFHLLINMAVGGISGYFPEGQAGKPWSDMDPHSVNAFYNSKGQWWPTWGNGLTEDNCLQIDSIKVWSFDTTEFQPTA